MEGALAILNKVHHNDHFGNYCQFFFYSPKSPKKIAKNIKMVYSRLTRKMYFDAIGRLCMKHSFEDSKFAGATMGQYREREILPKEAFDGVTGIEFEGDTFSAPVGWEAYLKSLYHDYMQLPPEEKRVTHHSFKAYWKE
jgi:lipopolysaccharide cholinephosphotransferase